MDNIEKLLKKVGDLIEFENTSVNEELDEENLDLITAAGTSTFVDYNDFMKKINKSE